AVAHQRRDLLLGLIHDARGDTRHHDVVEPVLALDLLHDGRVRHQEPVVLILAGRGRTFHLEDADHDAWLIFDANRFANRILRTEQLIYDSLSEYADIRRARNLDVRVHPAASDTPGFQRQVLGSDAPDRAVPVLIAVHHLHPRVSLRRDIRDE